MAEKIGGEMVLTKRTENQLLKIVKVFEFSLELQISNQSLLYVCQKRNSETYLLPQQEEF